MSNSDDSKQGLLMTNDTAAQPSDNSALASNNSSSTSANPAHIHLPKYDLAEEIAHAITHGIGAIASIVGLTVMIVFSALNGDYWDLLGSSIFGATLVLTFTASTLYHGITNLNVKSVLQKVDHAAIYLLIAGTYTPFLFTYFRETFGWSLFIGLWSLALFGVALEFVAPSKFKKLALVIYLGMGWAVVFIAKPMIETVPASGLWLLLAGGLSYTVGVIFYVWSKLPFNHAIWHVFVLAGAILHYLSVMLYVVPK